MTAGETVSEVNACWTAQRRQRSRTRGKRDQVDAHAVAKLVREAGTRLPPVSAEDQTTVLALLVPQREATRTQATRLRNHLHHLLLHLDPRYRDRRPRLTSAAGLRALETYMAESPSALQQQRVAAVRRLAQRLRLALEQGWVLKQQSCTLAEPGYAPLPQLTGVQLLTAGTRASLLGPGRRVTSEAQLAAYAGVAPLEASSAGGVRHRLNRGGNRHLNAVLSRIALTQARRCPRAQAYLTRRQAEGTTRREARRALKRYLVRAMWRLWQQCLDLEQSRSVQKGDT